MYIISKQLLIYYDDTSNLGDISEQQLLAVLKSLAIEIGIENTEFLQSLVEITSKFKRYFQSKYRRYTSNYIILNYYQSIFCMS